MSGWDNMAHSAGAYVTNYLQLPSLRMSLSVDNATESTSAPTEALKISTSYIDQHRLLYFAMEPFTSQRRLKIHQPVLLSPDTIKVSLGETIQVRSYQTQYRLTFKILSQVNTKTVPKW